MTLQPGQSLSAEDCKLLEAGDWLLDYGRKPVVFLADDYGMLAVQDGERAFSAVPAAFLFLGRPGADGFIPWTGGENPLPGHPVYIRRRDGEMRAGLSDCFSALVDWWAHEGCNRGCDIIAWRPAPSVEGLGALRPENRASVPTEREDGPSDQPFDWSEYEDDISDAISDSIDMDWSARDGAKAVIRCLAALSASGPAGWQPIETAPKDGTEIIIGKAGWQSCPRAKWGSHDGEDDEGRDIVFGGWFLASEWESYGGCEDGFLGWNEDIEGGAMPTHWMPALSAPGSEAVK